MIYNYRIRIYITVSTLSSWAEHGRPSRNYFLNPLLPCKQYKRHCCELPCFLAEWRERRERRKLYCLSCWMWISVNFGFAEWERPFPETWCFIQQSSAMVGFCVCACSADMSRSYSVHPKCAISEMGMPVGGGEDDEFGAEGWRYFIWVVKFVILRHSNSKSLPF